MLQNLSSPSKATSTQHLSLIHKKFKNQVEFRARQKEIFLQGLRLIKLKSRTSKSREGRSETAPA